MCSENRAVNASPGGTSGQVPSTSAFTGAVIGSRHTKSLPAGAKTWAYG